jgi:hypothetical protein
LWIRGFVRRSNLSIRKVTRTKQQTTVDNQKKTKLEIYYINSLNQLGINYDKYITSTASGVMLPSLVILKNLKSLQKCAIPRDVFVEVSGIGGF